MSVHTLVKRKYIPSIKDFLVHLSENPHRNFPVIAEVNDDFYVMEYIEGVTLADMVSQGILPQDKAKNYMLQLIDAVSQIHKFSIVHRDIKPENIIITKDDTLKLIDFDISRKIIVTKNCDTELLGTAGYAAPEQFGFTQTDERSDIYAMGIVYNYMLTGKFPIEKSVDGQEGKIIKKCTHLDKSARYKSVEHLRRDVLKERFTSYRLFDILPGFRTRNIYKMIFASFVYINTFIGYFLLAYEETPRTNALDIIMFYVVFAVMLLYAFLFFAIVTNFLGAADRLKFPVKNKKLKVILFLLLQYVVGIAVCFAIFGSFSIAIAYNPITATILLCGYMIYSIIESFIIGML